MGQEPGRFRTVLRGYKRSEVDALVTRIHTTLGPEQPGSESRVTAAEVRNAQFTLVVRGYDEKEVDEALEAYASELDEPEVPSTRERRHRKQAGRVIEDIQQAVFGTTRLGPGYDVRDVDAFLNRVVESLHNNIAMTGKDVEASRFRPTRMRPGYREQDVDKFLRTLADDLDRLTFGHTQDRHAPPGTG